MLNRHALVLFFGLAALVLLDGIPPQVGPLAAAFICSAAGLYLEDDEEGLRALAGRLLEALGAVLLIASGVIAASADRTTLPFGAASIAIAVTLLGLLVETGLPFAYLRLGTVLQAVGDIGFAFALGAGWVLRQHAPSQAGWVFIGLSGAVSLYAALSNGFLQARRVVDRQAGWRYPVIAKGPQGLILRTPEGPRTLPWQAIGGVSRLDRRRLVLVVDSAKAQGSPALPLDDLQTKDEQGKSRLAEQAALILHEQELGQPLAQAEIEISRVHRSNAVSG